MHVFIDSKLQILAKEAVTERRHLDLLTLDMLTGDQLYESLATAEYSLPISCVIKPPFGEQMLTIKTYED